MSEDFQKIVGYAKEIVLVWDGLGHDATFVVKFFEWEESTKKSLVFHLLAKSPGFGQHCLIKDGDDPYDDALLEFSTTHRTKTVNLIAKCLSYLRNEYTPYGK